MWYDVNKVNKEDKSMKITDTKIATDKIIEKFPLVEKELIARDEESSTEHTSSELTEVEQVFLDLALFFENPKEENFNLACLYKHLDNDWLEFALEAIHTFFHKDTFLIQDPTHSIITDGDFYLNQARFAEFLTENGLNYDNAKLSMYIKRGIVPEADITISGTKYWERSTSEKFLEEQLKKDFY